MLHVMKILFLSFNLVGMLRLLYHTHVFYV
jgi:hypothetical protein